MEKESGEVVIVARAELVITIGNDACSNTVPEDATEETAATEAVAAGIIGMEVTKGAGLLAMALAMAAVVGGEEENPLTSPAATATTPRPVSTATMSGGVGVRTLGTVVLVAWMDVGPIFMPFMRMIVCCTVSR